MVSYDTDILDNALVMIVVMDDTGKVEFWNHTANSITGYPASEVTGKAAIWKLLYPDDNYRKTLTTKIKEILSSRDYFVNIETTICTKTGESRTILWNTREIIRDGHPKIIASAVDISEQKRAEEKLSQSQAMLDAFFEASPAILNIDDENLRYLKTDKLTPQYFGLDRESLVGKSVRDLAPDFFEKSGSMLMGVIETGRPELNVEVSSPHPKNPHEMIYWRSSYFPVPLENGKRGLGVIGVEITDIKKAEQLLRDSEEMFRNPVERSPVGIYLIQDGHFRYANYRLAQMFGYSREEFLNQPWRDYIVDGDSPKAGQTIAGSLDGDEQLLTRVFRGRKRDGTIIHLEEFGSTMIYQGRPARYGTVIDVTERMQMEMQIAGSLVEKETLLKEIHHRVRNNLQVITSLIALQEQYIADAKSLTDIKEIRLRIGAMTMVHEIAHQENTPDSINMESLLSRLTPRVIGEFPAISPRVRLILNADPVQLKLTQAIPCSLIVTELLMNSMGHAFPDRHDGEISIGFSIVDQICHLDYADNGAGFPEGVSLEEAGTAGLILIRGLISQLSGTVDITTRPGTRYSITFPAEIR
jgi:PAS domain S-box-containing protein